MRIAMINDCAFVGETILKYLPSDVDKLHIKRSRNLWDKTIGLALKISKTKADVYHVNYLLQDCFLALQFKKRPLFGHAHGSDLKYAIKHHIWGRIVKYNLKRCNRIIVSTPDILPVAKEIRDDVEYIPNPVDLNLFHVQPLASDAPRRKRVLIASNLNWSIKGIDTMLRALRKIRDKVEVKIIGQGPDLWNTINLAKSFGIKFTIIIRVPHSSMPRLYWSSDVILDNLKVGSLGMTSLEAIACGRPVVTYVSSEYEEYKDFPLKDVRSEVEVADAIEQADFTLWRRQYEYLLKNHDPKIVAEKWMNLYNEV